MIYLKIGKIFCVISYRKFKNLSNSLHECPSCNEKLSHTLFIHLASKPVELLQDILLS